MYSLKVLESFAHPDGRLFEVGHDCNSLDAFEVSELMVDYPKFFAANNESTIEFLKDTENMMRLASAYKSRK